MTIAILGALAIAWVVVLLPGRSRPPGYSNRGFGRPTPPPKRLRVPLTGTTSLMGALGARLGLFRPGRERPTRVAPMPPLGGPSRPGLTNGPAHAAAPAPIALNRPQVRSYSRRVTPVTSTDAALRRRDVTAILVVAMLVTLIALFATRQAWLGIIHILVDVTLVLYLSMVHKRTRLDAMPGAAEAPRQMRQPGFH